MAEPDSLTDDERSELVWLRKENTLLRVERDILVRVASGYAKDMAAMTASARGRRRTHQDGETP